MKGITALLLVLAGALTGCGTAEKQEETADYPERTHGEGKALLTLTRHQLGHIEFAMETAEIKAVTVPLSLPARIALDDMRTAHITARVTGRVEKVHHVLGDRVRKGGVVLEVFSQEFLAMQSEFISAEERLKRMNASQSDYGTAKAIYESARRKLKVVGLEDQEIDSLADDHVPHALLPVRAPIGGALITGEVRAGEYMQTGAEFFTIADLGVLWVIADVFEHDLPLVEEGLMGEVSVAPYPTETFRARLVRILDVVDAKSRTIKVRFEVRNVRDKLKPEMFATVNINSQLDGKSLKVPSNAVMTQAGNQYVFVAINDTMFEQRSVRVGFETKAYTEILEGLKPGERVVSKGTFYLKSELAKSSFVEEE